MTVLLLRLSGPMQSWGDSSRFVRRTTRNEPTKSGVIGLMAAALGRSREDSVEDLAALEFGVRADQPGNLIVDFQTEKTLGDAGKSMPLSYRYYLSDAKFLAALGGDDELLKDIDAALKHPCWPLYLGRRSCPPDGPVSLGLHEEYEGVRDALGKAPWLASQAYRKKHSRTRELEAVCDAKTDEEGISQADIPITFSGSGRKYANRKTWRCRIEISGLEGETAPRKDGTDKQPIEFHGSHDPMSFF
ncbi:type I-E CRISPR-associated protein Cas5/CasD [Olsenella sp. AGMB03486]|uniref:type I-E CRISPR-associated protein Cas5/CasD n=1 Tax=Olsenella sp. AGMB03486 TaxID=3230364 RepID=UPI00349FF91C